MTRIVVDLETVHANDTDRCYRVRYDVKNLEICMHFGGIRRREIVCDRRDHHCKHREIEGSAKIRVGIIPPDYVSG